MRKSFDHEAGDQRIPGLAGRTEDLQKASAGYHHVTLGRRRVPVTRVTERLAPALIESSKRRAAGVELRASGAVIVCAVTQPGVGVARIADHPQRAPLRGQTD